MPGSSSAPAPARSPLDLEDASGPGGKLAWRLELPQSNGGLALVASGDGLLAYPYPNPRYGTGREIFGIDASGQIRWRAKSAAKAGYIAASADGQGGVYLLAAKWVDDPSAPTLGPSPTIADLRIPREMAVADALVRVDAEGRERRLFTVPSRAQAFGAVTGSDGSAIIFGELARGGSIGGLLAKEGPISFALSVPREGQPKNAIRLSGEPKGILGVRQSTGALLAVFRKEPKPAFHLLAADGAEIGRTVERIVTEPIVDRWGELHAVKGVFMEDPTTHTELADDAVDVVSYDRAGRELYRKRFPRTLALGEVGFAVDDEGQAIVARPGMTSTLLSLDVTELKRDGKHQYSAQLPVPRECGAFGYSVGGIALVGDFVVVAADCPGVADAGAPPPPRAMIGAFQRR